MNIVQRSTKLCRKICLRIRYPHLTVGKNFEYSPGFIIYNGQKNILIGDHCNLVNAQINAGDTEKLIIEDHVFFGHAVKILLRSHDYTQFNTARQTTVLEKPITIKKGAWIASGATILGGVTIGEHAVVSAGSVVTKNVPAYTLVAGVPAIKVRRFKITKPQ